MKALHVTLAVLLFACLLDWPYGYYQFVRWSAMVGFGVLAYDYAENGHKKFALLFVGLAILFQPFEKIALGREMWNIIDVVVGLGLLVLAYQGNTAKAVGERA